MSEYRFPRTCFRILFSGLFVFAATVCSAQDASVVTAPQALSAEAASLPSGTSEPPENLDDLLDLGIEELGNVQAVPSFDVEVTSVTRSRSTVGKSPAAVFVMDREMIRRTGANSISELLRHVPGLQVARNSSSRTAVSSRGFNNVFSNKLLVMIDGRSVYTQLFGGVYWEVQDLVLQDIERIEVIRGPGATVWGANAVNGVINIITRRSQDTVGTLFTTGGGDQDRMISQFRHGFQVGDDFFMRISAKHRELNEGLGPGHDDWRFGQIGFRADWTPDSGPDSLTFLGQLYDGVQGTFAAAEAIPGPPFVQRRIRDTTLNGGHALARWTHEIDEETSWTVQAYYDRTKRSEIATDFSLDIWDLDFQYQSKPWDDHKVTWGLQFRHYSDNVTETNPFVLSVDDTSKEIRRTGVFIQDEYSLSEDLRVIFGSKFSYNDLSRYEYQPSARAVYSLDETHAVWGAVSKAVRTPSRVADDLMLRQLAVAPFVFAQVTGNDRLQAEDLTAWELGYRAQETESISWDAAVFFNRYDDLIGFVRGPLMAGLPPTFPLTFQDGGRGDTYGFELNSRWNVTECWTLRAWYAFLRLRADGTGQDASLEGSAPRNTVQLMSSWNLTEDVELDVITRYVDSLPARDVESYFDLDVRVGYAVRDNLSLQIVGQNLLDGSRSEFLEKNALPSPSEVRRGVYGQVEWRY